VISRIGPFLAGVLLAATACAEPTPAGESVPALRDRLDRVDAALADADYGQARRALAALTAEAQRAEDAGRLPTGQADRIVAAAARLVAGLPATPAPAPSTSTPPPPDPDEGDDDNSGPGNGDEDGDDDNSGPG
jgi:hypothetical protein